MKNRDLKMGITWALQAVGSLRKGLFHLSSVSALHFCASFEVNLALAKPSPPSIGGTMNNAYLSFCYLQACTSSPFLSQLHSGCRSHFLRLKGRRLVNSHSDQLKTIPTEAFKDGRARIRTGNLSDPAASQSRGRFLRMAAGSDRTVGCWRWWGRAGGMKEPLIALPFIFQYGRPEGPHVHYTPVEYALSFVAPLKANAWM